MYRSRFQIACAVCCIATIASNSVAPAQTTATNQLLTNYVEKVDERYKDVDNAVVMFSRNSPKLALGLLGKAVKEHPELPPAEVLYAHLCFSANRADAGRAVLEIAVVQRENDPEAWVMLADLAMRAGRMAEADVLFQKALEKVVVFKGNDKRQKYIEVNAHAGLARVDERRGQWQDAEQHLSRWLELQPKNMGAMRRMASAKFSQEKFDEARDMLQSIRDQDENQPLPEVVMGILHQRSGQLDESDKMMQEAVKKGSDDVVTLMAVAEWALNAGKVDMAQTHAASVLKLKEDADRAKLLEGKVLRFKGDAAGAENIFRTIYDKSPASFAASNELALSLMAQDDDQKHKQALQYAQVNATRYKDPRTSQGREAAATFAWGLHKVGQDAAAEKVIQQVITSGEVSPQIGYFAAMIFKSRGRVDIAQQLLQRAVGSVVAFPEEQSAQKLLDALGDAPKEVGAADEKEKPAKAEDSGTETATETAAATEENK